MPQPYIDVTGATAYREATGDGTVVSPYIPRFTAVQQGTWNVGLTGTLPAFAATPTFNIGTAPNFTFTNTSFTANAGTNLNTSLLALESGGNLASINTKLPSNLTVTATRLLVDGSGVTQPVSLATLPTLPAGTNNIGSLTNITGTISLPTGAATAANQTTGNTSLSSIDGKLPTLVNGKVPVDVSSLNVTVSNASLEIANDVGNPVPISDAGGSITVDGTFWQATQPISAASLPLPTGAATAANQTTGNTSLSSIDGKTPALGQALAAASVPVVLPAAQITTLTPPTSVGISGTLPAFAATPTVNIGTAPSLTFTNTSFTANAGTNLNTSALALESGGNLASINTKLPSNLTVTATRLLVDGSGVTQPVSLSTLPTGTNNIGSLTNITGTISLPTGAATAANQTTGNTSLSSIDSKTPALGQALATASVPVVLPAAQITTLTPPTSVGISGTLPAFATTPTFNIGTSSLALESGGNLASINTKLPSNLTVTATRLLVDGSGVTQPVSAASLPLPTGAATSANQTTGNTLLSSIDGKLPSSLGTKTSSASLSVSPAFAATSTLTNVASSGTSVTLLAANNNRKTVIILNDSTSDLYVTLNASAASTTNYSLFLAAKVGNTPSSAIFGGDDYSGEIRGIWSSANGFARITEVV
jgi:hypothetical protein